MGRCKFRADRAETRSFRYSIAISDFQAVVFFSS